MPLVTTSSSLFILVAIFALSFLSPWPRAINKVFLFSSLFLLLGASFYLDGLTSNPFGHKIALFYLIFILVMYLFSDENDPLLSSSGIRCVVLSCIGLSSTDIRIIFSTLLATQLMSYSDKKPLKQRIVTPRFIYTLVLGVWSFLSLQGLYNGFLMHTVDLAQPWLLAPVLLLSFALLCPFPLF